MNADGENSDKFDKFLDSLNDDLFKGLSAFLDGVKETLTAFPPELKVNILTNIMVLKFSEYVVTIRDNNMAIEAAGIKKQFLGFIEELDKTMVSEKDKPFVGKIKNSPAS